MRRALLAIGFLLSWSRLLCAQAQLPPPAGELPAPIPMPSQQTTPTVVYPEATGSQQIAIIPPASAAPTTPYPETTAQSQIAIIPPAGGVPLTAYPNPVREPPWCESPYRHSAWRFDIGLIPAVSDVSDDGFGGWDDRGGFAARIGLGYEGSDGYGTRLQFWGFGEKADTFVSEVELDASTFYWDFYKRFFVDNAELLVGGGIAGAHMKYDAKDFHEHADFSGGGISIYGEGFFPIWKFTNTDIGSIARARVALLEGRWDDHGLPFIDDNDHDVMSILELGWGLEIRHRFGLHGDKYCYFDIVPEFQSWKSNALPDDFDPSFQGTNFTFGVAW